MHKVSIELSFESLEDRQVMDAGWNGVPLTIPDDPGVALLETRFEAEDLTIKSGGFAYLEGWVLTENGSIGEVFDFATAGHYTITLSALGTTFAGQGPLMSLIVDGVSVTGVEVTSGDLTDYIFEVDIASGVHELRVGFSNDQMSQTEDRNLLVDSLTFTIDATGWTPPAVTTKAAWQAAMQERENALLAETDLLIEQHRKGNASVTVRDLEGNLLSGATVTVEQTRHSFLFGANLFMFQRFGTEEENARYLELFREVFNYAAVPFYWNTLESSPGSRDYSYTDALIQWGRDHGIALKGHAPLWNVAEAWPTWMTEAPSLQYQADFIAELFTRYQGQITTWDLVNEPFHREGIDLTTLYTLASSLDADARLLINEYGAFADGAEDLWLFLNEIIDQLPVDGFGLQAHEPPDERFGMTQIWSVLEKYAALGAPLHISEFSPTSSGAAFTGNGWEGDWTEAAQADYVERFYRTAFAHPDVREISWWDLADAGAYLSGGGLLRSDLSTKPAFDRLKSLITEEWHTSQTALSDAAGSYDFRGFYGSYDVTVVWNGKQAKASFDLQEGTNNTWVISIDVSAQPVANAGGDYAFAEGQSLTLDASASQSSVVGGILTFQWDLNGDGDYSDASGARPTLSWDDLSGLGLDGGAASRTIAVRVSDQFGGVSTAYANLSIANTSPMAAWSGPASAVRGETRTFILTAEDLSPVDQAAGFTFLIDWNGDGSVDETVFGPSGTQIEHHFDTAGDFRVTIQAVDQDGGVSNTFHRDIRVTQWELRADEADPTKVDLLWGGTRGSDVVGFIPGFALVQMENNAYYFQPQLVYVGGYTGRLIVYARGGADFIYADALSNPAVFFGGDGVDVLVGGRGADTIFGEDGDDILFGGTLETDSGDVLYGGAGNDFIVGHFGPDSIYGGAGEDLLVAGILNFSDLASSVYSIQSEWLSSRSIGEKVANLRGIGSGPRNNGEAFLIANTSALDDAVVDHLLGNEEADWFLYDLATDLALFSSAENDLRLDL